MNFNIFFFQILKMTGVHIAFSMFLSIRVMA